MIPTITDDRLRELSARIVPVVPKDGVLHYIKPCPARTVAFPWSPAFTTAAEDIEPCGEITTYHTWGYYGFFKPSIAEVLSFVQGIPNDDIVAFSTIGPETADDLNAQWSVVQDGFHRATTTLYRRKG